MPLEKARVVASAGSRVPLDITIHGDIMEGGRAGHRQGQTTGQGGAYRGLMVGDVAGAAPGGDEGPGLAAAGAGWRAGG